MTTLHPKLQIKLEVKIEEYQKVTEFAEKLPLFANDIIAREYTGEEFVELAHTYKDMRFNWGINWYCDRPTNYPEYQPCEIGLVSVYINCCSLFHEDMYAFAHTELEKTIGKIKCYFYDDLNSTFYFKADEVEAGLDAIVEWYNATKVATEIQLKEIKRKKLEAELKALDN